MKKQYWIIGYFVIFLLSLHVNAEKVSAACNWSAGTSTITAVTCGIDGQSTEAYDYSAGTDDALNGAVLNVPAGVTITLNAGVAGTPTTLLIGSISSPDTAGVGGTGIIVSSSSYVTIRAGSSEKCYVTDADGDGYSPSANTCFTTAAAGRIRKFSSGYHTGTDCGDGSATANPGQSVAQTGTFTNSVNASLTGDWNCNGSEVKTYSTATYSCAGCTNGSGYASFINSTSGFLTTVPNCGASGTYYTVSNATCRDPAVADCSTSRSTSTVSQTCL